MALERNINWSISQTTNVSLHRACKLGDLLGVRYFVEQGEDIDTVDEESYTPLYIACQEGHLAIVQYLVEQGADKDKAEEYGWTPLLVACEKGHLSVVQYLVEQGADKDKADQEDTTPLYIACEKGRLAIVQYLVAQGADKDKAAEDGWTPLLIAIQGKHIAIIALLLAYGAQYDESLTQYIIQKQNNAAVVELFAIAQTWPLPRNAYHRLMCGLDWLACYFKQQNSDEEPIFFESWRKQFEIGRARLTTLLVLATTRTVENEPRYSHCGLHRLPLAVLFYFIHHGALIDCPDSHLPLASATVNLNLPEYQLQACRLMGFWSISATQRVLSDVAEERKVEEIDDDETDAIQAATQANARELKIDARPQFAAGAR